MKVKPINDVKTNLSAYVAAAEPVVITRNGSPAAMLVPVSADVDVEDLALAYSPKFQELIRQSRERMARGEGISHEQLMAEVEAGELGDRDTASSSG